jgi:hypothetical protein
VASKTWLARLCLQICAPLSFFLGVSAVAFCFFSTARPDDALLLVGVGILGGGVALAVVCLWLASGLGRRRFWAWVLSLMLFLLFLPTLYFPLGLLGLWGLLDRGTKDEFGFKRKAPPAPPPAAPPTSTASAPTGKGA